VSEDLKQRHYNLRANVISYCIEHYNRLKCAHKLIGSSLYRAIITEYRIVDRNSKISVQFTHAAVHKRTAFERPSDTCRFAVRPSHDASADRLTGRKQRYGSMTAHAQRRRRVGYPASFLICQQRCAVPPLW